MLIPIDVLLRKYNLRPKSVLHVGANEGQEARTYMRAGINSGVFIEALPNVYSKLVRNLQHTPYRAMNACISDKDYDTVEFNVANNGGQSSSLLEFGQPHLQAHPEVKMTHKVTMKTVRLETLLGGEEFDFINFDLQGAELMALRSMGKLMKHVSSAYLEINKRETYRGAALIDDVTEFMGKHGLVMVEQSAWIGDTWADSFWTRTKRK